MSAVHLVALAARTPVGLTAESTAAAIRAGISRVQEHPRFAGRDGQHVLCGRVSSLPVDLTGPARLAELALQAAHELGQKLGEGLVSARHALLALPEPRPGLPRGYASAVQRALVADAARWPRQLQLLTHEQGHAGGLACIREAHALVSSGREDLCIVGGVDSYLESDTIDWMESERRLVSEGNRSGFVPGESAAFVALASDAGFRQLRLNSEAVVRGIACDAEARSPQTKPGLLGEALARVYSQAGAALAKSHWRFDDVYCDINGERPRTTDYGFAIMRTATLFRDGHEYRTPNAQIGDVGAASAILNCVLAARAWARGYAHGPNALVSAASWGGLRGAAWLEQPARQR